MDPNAWNTYMGDGTVALSKLMAPGIGTGTDSFPLPRTYPNIDRFNRPTKSRWVSTGGGGAFYDVDIAYDESSNITRVIDYVQVDPGAGGSGAGTHAFDAAYSIDGLNRVARAHEGKWDTSSITTAYRDEQWVLTQTGNWDRNKLDLDGNGTFNGTGEHDDTRTHNNVNEITKRDIDSVGGTDFALAYNLRGDLQDEGGTGGYKYVYDAFGRLVELRRQNNSLVAAYRYNGLNQRITWHYDADEDADVDGSDPVYHFCYDDKWRIVGVWRGADTDPKELFIYHNAGVAGYGGSSYIDSVVLRDRDNSSKWSQASDGTLETRHYYAQNWRADVSAIFDNAGAVVEWIKYSAYGVPYLLTLGDHNKDGVINKDDQDAFDADYAANHPRADLNKDGAWTTADQTLFYTSHGKAVVGGRWKLSAGDVGNRKGYAGYEHEGFGNDLAAPELAHVRHRVLHFGLGRWTRRDPLVYVDGVNTNEYSNSSPIEDTDFSGLCGGGCTAQIAMGQDEPPKWRRGTPLRPHRPQRPSCTLEICCGPMGSTLGQASHCWTRCTNGGTTTACRAGPTGLFWDMVPIVGSPNANPAPSCPGWTIFDGAWGPIDTYCGPWDASHPDWHYGQSMRCALVRFGSDVCDKCSCIQNMFSRIEGCCIGYEALGPNCNSVINTALIACGIGHSRFPQMP